MESDDDDLTPEERAEDEYQEWCWWHGLDPDDTQTMIAYEEAFEQENET